MKQDLNNKTKEQLKEIKRKINKKRKRKIKIFWLIVNEFE